MRRPHHTATMHHSQLTFMHYLRLLQVMGEAERWTSRRFDYVPSAAGVKVAAGAEDEEVEDEDTAQAAVSADCIQL